MHISTTIAILQHQFLKIPHKKVLQENDQGNFFDFLIFYCIFEYFGTRGVHCTKRNSKLESTFFPKGYHF